MFVKIVVTVVVFKMATLCYFGKLTKYPSLFQDVSKVRFSYDLYIYYDMKQVYQFIFTFARAGFSVHPVLVGQQIRHPANLQT